MSLLAVFISSLASCLFLTPIVRLLAVRFGLVDRPDGQRKLQARAVPLGGGLAILLSAMAAVVIAATWSPLRSDLLGQLPMLIGLGCAALWIAAVGLVDDSRGLRGRTKLIGQFVAVVIVMASGVVIRSVSFFGADVNLGLLSYPFTAFLLLGAINSLNLLDGMDGLLSCIGLIVCIALAVVATQLAHWPAACIATALAGALLGFLRYNSPPASIFMGDCGSMVVGLVIGVMAIQGSLKGTATVALTAPLTILTLPIFDTLAAIVRRRLTGRSIYAPDRGHLHHCLLRSGLTVPRVLVCVAVLSLVTLIGALASVVWHAEWVALVSALAVVLMLVATRSFGHAEFELLKKRLVHKFSGAQANGGPRYLEVRIQGKADWSSLGHDLAAQAEELGLISLCLDINAPALHEAYLGRWERGGDQPEDHSIWRTQIPLSAAGHSLGRLDIVGRGSGQSTSSKIAILAGLVEDLEFGLGNIIRRARVHTSPVAANGRSPLSIFAVNGEHVAASVGTQTALYEEANGETYLDSELGNGDLSSSRKPR